MAARVSWMRVAWTCAVMGPALALGGVHPLVVAIELLVLLAIGNALTRGRALDAPRSKRSERAGLVSPRGWWIAMIPIGLTLAQLMPLTHHARRVVAPRLHAEVAPLFVVEPTTFALAPADTALALATFVAAALVFFLAGQVPWTRTATAVGLGGVVVSGWAVVHGVTGTDALFFVYEPRQVQLSGPGYGYARPWLGTFVNANHQASFLLLSLAASAAMALDAARSEQDQRLRLWIGAVTLQALALVFTGSRLGLVAGVLLGLGLGWLARRQLSRRPGVGAVAFALAATGLVVLAALRGPLRELWLTDWSSALQDKLASVEIARTLLERSPLWGLGAGGFGELSSRFDPEGGAIVWAHVESFPFEMAAAIGWPGVLALTAACGWWTVVHVRAHRARGANVRLALMAGLAAVALCSLGDFALMSAGVLVPFAALAGTVSERDPLRLERVRVRKLVLTASVGATLFAVLPGRHTRVVRPTMPANASALRIRPLDAMLHLRLARRAAAEEDWGRVMRFAGTAGALRPASVEAHLLLSVAHRHGDASHAPDRRASDKALGDALSRLRDPATESLVRWVAGSWTPEELAEIIDAAELDPDSPTTRDAVFRRLAWPMADVSPRHARALAHAQRRRAPDDPEPERLGFEVAQRRGDVGLALHHSMTWRALVPHDGDAWLAVARAHRLASKTEGAARLDAAIEALEQGTGVVRDPTELGGVEEAWVRALIERGGPGDLERARALLPTLRRRPATAEARRRRSKLARTLRE